MFVPAKEALHVLEEGVGPLPGGHAPLPLGVAAHCAAANQVSFQMPRSVYKKMNLICKGKDLCVIEFVTGGQEQDWRPRRLHCLLLLPPLACRTLQDLSLVLIKYIKIEV